MKMLSQLLLEDLKLFKIITKELYHWMVRNSIQLKKKKLKDLNCDFSLEELTLM